MDKCLGFSDTTRLTRCTVLLFEHERLDKPKVQSNLSGTKYVLSSSPLVSWQSRGKLPLACRDHASAMSLNIN